MTEPDHYRARGVSAQKEEVHAAIRDTDPGLFPGAFCKIVPDRLSGDERYCLAMHADGAGTKSSLAYLMYRETGDAGVFRGIAQDALTMNLDDLLCVGTLGPFLVSNAIGRNARLVPGEVIGEIVAGFEAQAARWADWGIEVVLTGGETADVGDLVRTVIVDATATARMRRTDVIANAGVKPGDVIVGLASAGETVYEPGYNSGMGSNGLTSARHDLLAAEYGERYPESFDPLMPQGLSYGGPHRLGDPLPGTPLTVGQALLSPTRSYAPAIKPLLDRAREQVSALVHCTGGGQTKVLRTGRGIHYVKDNLFPLPPLFAEIRRVTQAPWRELYRTFNMGHRMEIIGGEGLVPVLEAIGQEIGLDVRVVGHCEASPDGGRNRVTLTDPDGEQVVYRAGEP
ncbi:MAG: AIR synthase-related protein [SAR324 cluster bacterium]|nr:AIR synthase-related protein [SAR324 cluster bacterium]